MTFSASIFAIIICTLSLQVLLVTGEFTRLYTCPCNFQLVRQIDNTGATNDDPFDVVVKSMGASESEQGTARYSKLGLKVGDASHSDSILHHFKGFSIPEHGIFQVTLSHKSSSQVKSPSYMLTNLAVSQQLVCPILLPFDIPPFSRKVEKNQHFDLATRQFVSKDPPTEGNEASPNIVGGLFTGPGIRRYVVSLRTPVICSDGVSDCFSFCTATLIDTEWLVTAAHCELNVADTMVFINSDLAGDGAFAGITEFHRHPLYDESNFNSSTHDIAVAKLSVDVIEACDRTDLCGGTPAIMRMNVRKSNPKEGQYLRTVGFGRISSDETVTDPAPGALRQVDAPVSNFESCKASYLSLRQPVLLKKQFQLCVGYFPEGQCDSCQGDSGGPVLGYDNREPVLVGVVSVGVGCGFLPGASVLTSAHKKWMKKVGAKFTPFKKRLRQFGPMCRRGQFLKFQRGIATCEKCPRNGYSRPPMRLCFRCPENTLRDTIRGDQCSCRRKVGFGQDGAKCKRCPTGKSSPFGKNECS